MNIQIHIARKRLMLLVAVTLVGAILWFGSETGKARFGGELNASYSQMQKISEAVSEYRRVNGRYPMRTEVIEGIPHSWRVLILPFMGHASLFEEYHFDEPWDSVQNARILNQIPAEFGNSEDGRTRFLALAGEGTVWSLAEHCECNTSRKSRRFNALIVESSQSIPWTSTRDLEIQSICPSDVFLHSRDRIVIGFADGFTDVVPFSTVADLQTLALDGKADAAH